MKLDLEPATLWTAFEQVLNRHPFQPLPWLRHSHLQTLAASLARRRYPWGWRTCQQRAVTLSDGSQVRLDCIWQEGDSPVLVAIHGMGGSSQSTYMQGLSHKAFREGWSAALVNLYNRNRALSRPKIFHAGSSLEVGEIIERLIEDCRLKGVFLVGASMGGNILLKLLGEWGCRFPSEVQGAAALSPLLDLNASWPMLEKPSNRIFQRHFVRGFKRRMAERREELEPFLDLERVFRIRTVRQFDELVTAPLGGFADVWDYYQRASAISHLGRIRIPTVILHSRDDPFLPWQPLRRPEVEANPALRIVLTERGGHLGFLEGNSRGDIDRRWGENRVVDFFRVSRQMIDSGCR